MSTRLKKTTLLTIHYVRLNDSLFVQLLEYCRHRLPIPLLILSFLCFKTFAAIGQFTNVSAQLEELNIQPSISTSNFGSGVGFYDFDNDGWDDLTLTGTDSPVYFLRNNHGELEPVLFNIPSSATGSPMSAIWVDFDNDGDSDFFINYHYGPVELWENDGNFNFSNITIDAGLPSGNYRYANAAWGDYNHDGFTDLYITQYYTPNFTPHEEFGDQLYRNNGDGTFSNVTEEAGVFVPPNTSLQAIWADLNNDGWEDLFVAVDKLSFSNELFINNQDGTFTRTTLESGVGESFDAMSAAVSDYNQDGYLDIYVSNNPIDTGNRLYKNNGDGTFTNTAPTLGINAESTCWGAVWLDHNNNTLNDLFVGITGLSITDNLFYVHGGAEGYSEQANQVGLNDPAARTFNCARGDLNNDGYFDLALSNYTPIPHQIYSNDGGANNWLSVKLEGTIANRDGLGTWIKFYAQGECFVKYTLSSENLGGQNSRKNIFGLGDGTSVDSLVLEWNSGTREVYMNPEVNTHHYYIEGASFTQPFEIQTIGSTALCPGDSVVLSAGDYLSYLWNTGDTTQTIVVSQPGAYSAEVVNEFGLSVSSIPVVVSMAPQTEVSLNAQNVSCSGAANGMIEAVFSTGAPDSITWNNGSESSVLENLSAGIYSFSGADQNGCAVSGEVYVGEPAPLLAQMNTMDPLCFGYSDGSVTSEVIGGTPPYSTDWNGLNPDAVPSGNYNVVVSDNNGCEVEVPFQVSQPDSLWAVLNIIAATDGDNGSVTTEIFGGTPPYDIVWSNGETDTMSLTNLPAGSYSVSITDENNCTAEINFEVDTHTGIPAENLYSRLRIFPNPSNGIFSIAHCPTSIQQMQVYNSHGQTVWKQHGASGHDVIDLSALGAGVYYLHLSFASHRKILPVLITP